MVSTEVRTEHPSVANAPNQLEHFRALLPHPQHCSLHHERLQLGPNHYFPIKLLAGKKMAWFKPAAIEVHHHSKVNSKSLWGIDLSWCGLWTHAVSPQQRWRISVWRGQPLMTGAFRRQSPLKRLIRSQSEPGQSATMQKLSKRVFSRQFCTSAQATSLTVGDGIDHWFGPCFEGTLRCEQILNLNSTTNQSFPVVLYDGFWIDSLLILKAKKKKKSFTHNCVLMSTPCTFIFNCLCI